MKSEHIIRGALASLLAIGAVGASTNAFAADFDKCAGIA